MARLARMVLPGYPHHIIQRGNRRQPVFFNESDYSYYLELLKEWCTAESIEIWLLKAAAYVELNPVKAGMVKHAWDYRWSSVHAHLSGYDADGLVKSEKLLSLTGDWKTYLYESQVTTDDSLEKHERTGRPLGSEAFLERAELTLQRQLKKKKPGPKSADGDN